MSTAKKCKDCPYYTGMTQDSSSGYCYLEPKGIFVNGDRPACLYATNPACGGVEHSCPDCQEVE